jgi:glycosyltransferase involved in cell wall biosynthesis
MVPGKGVSELLRAAAILRAEFPLEVRLAGDGPDRFGLEKLAMQLGLGHHVVFAGTALDVAPFWSECDVAAFPTNEWIESFGLAAVEAMACSRPVVASRSGGLREVIQDGRTGTLVQPGDVNGLAAALKRYALDRSLRDRHGREARADCERRFDIKRTATQYRALFESWAITSYF